VAVQVDLIGGACRSCGCSWLIQSNWMSQAWFIGVLFTVLVAGFHGLIFPCAVADRAVLKITEEEFSGLPMDVSFLNTPAILLPRFVHV
jgi:hypothetical protein